MKPRTQSTVENRGRRGRSIRILLVVFATACWVAAVAPIARAQERACKGVFHGFDIEYDCDDPITLWVWIENTAIILTETYRIEWWMNSPDGGQFSGITYCSVPAGEHRLCPWDTGVLLDAAGTWYYGVDVWDDGDNYCWWESSSLLHGRSYGHASASDGFQR